jgi:hypothetical protein
MGTLTIPIDCNSVQIKRFSIPNAGTPLMEWVGDNVFQFTLTYKGYSFQQYVLLENRGSANFIYEIDHLVSMINTALSSAVTGLDALYFVETGLNLPTMTSPYLIFDGISQLYSVVALTSAYSSLLPEPITISLNYPLFTILQSLPIYVIGNTFQLLFKPSGENVYLTNYTKITQESITFPNYFTPQNIVITTNLPIEPEFISSSTQNSGGSSLSILQDYAFDFTSGVKDFKTHNIYNAPTEDYRRVKCVGRGIYNVRCQVYNKKRDGSLVPFILLPYQSASIKLHFII